MMDEELSAYRKAGKIASDVREWSKGLVKVDAKLLDVADKIEKKIEEKKAGIAFPVNICINDVAAHYAPKFNDETRIMKNDVVTIDLGVHIDGYIADTAYTIDLSGKYDKMLAANENALEAAIELIKPGASISDIGAAVQKTLNDAGYKPIENLTGHEVEQYDLHAGIAIPNIKLTFDRRIEEDMVLAIEPFATDGAGRVVEARQAEIFSLQNLKPIRMKEARMLLDEIADRGKLPFAQRWYEKKINPVRMSLALNNLLSAGILYAHPVLHEKNKGIVSQFEHTIIVTADGGEVTTR
jgi:methionyl aminopeptidase